MPIITSPAVQVDYRIRQNNFDPWILSVLAGGDCLGLGNRRYLQYRLGRHPVAALPKRRHEQDRRAEAGIGHRQRGNPSQGQITFRLAN